MGLLLLFTPTGIYDPSKSITWSIQVDWHLDAGYHEEASYAVGPLTREGGRAGVFDEIDATKLTVVLDNETRRFDPWYASSLLYPNVLPRRPIIVQATYDNNTYTIFKGKIEEIRPEGGLGKRRVTITAYDGLRDLASHTASVALQKAVTTDVPIGLILTDAGWGAGATYRALDTGSDTLTYWWCDESALAAIQSLVRSEGGIFFISHDGKATFYSRSTMILGTSVADIDEDIITDIVLTQPWDLIRNTIRVVAYPVTLANSGDIWQLEDDAVSIAAGESKTIWANFHDANNVSCAADTVIDPAKTTDWTASATQGGPDNMTDWMTVTPTIFSKAAKLVVANTHATTTFYITLLKIRGKAITQTAFEVKRENTTSQTAYGKRLLEMDVPWQQSESVAADLADSKLGFYKDPQKGAVITIERRMHELLDVDIFDRVDFTCPIYSISESMRVGHMTLQTDEGMQKLRGELSLEAVDNSTYWLLGVVGNSEVGVTTRLGY